MKLFSARFTVRPVPTNPIPEGTINVPVNLPKELDTELRRLAKKSNVSRSAYCVAVLKEAAKAGAVVENQTVVIYPEPKPSSIIAQDDKSGKSR